LVNESDPEIEAFYRERLMALPAAERFIRGALMFDAARTMVLASFPPGLPPHEVRRRLFERLYGAELAARLNVDWTAPERR